ncbi:unnamed protein product [Penicillium salamii]|nr:unnamed protein product [Penicillium salamii]
MGELFLTALVKIMDSNSARLLQAFEKATVQLKFCPNRVWAVAGEDLPNLLPQVETHEAHNDKNKHELCTFDFCEYSRRDFTSVPQRCECGEEVCRKIGYQFPSRILDEAAKSGKSTAWKLTGHSMLESPRPFMAVSHVWSDGTGAGSWREAEVNKCLYGFFRDIAEQFECEGIWWDTICIPRGKAARTQAIQRMHINYQDARITLVHDLFLRDWEWDPKTACFAILMSPWFSRGWTALELAQSPKVKVIFKGPQGPIVKDLDEEILAQKDGDDEDEHEMRRRRASQIIRNLRRKITSVNELLTVLGSRYTSWPKDLSVISALLVEVKPHESQQNTYMRIVRKLAKISPGHLFHNSATMSGGLSWCPTSLFSMPLDNHPRSILRFSETGIEGNWRVYCMENALEKNFMWNGPHPLIRHHIQDTLKKYPDQCLLLAECGSEVARKALLVRVLPETKEKCHPIRCQYIGAVHLRNEMKFEKIDEVVIVHDDGLLLEQEEQTPTACEKKTSDVLKQAIWRGDYAEFKELVGQVDLNEPDELGRRPLHLAAERGQDQMIRDLVRFGADLSARCHDGQTAFHRAAWGGSVQVVGFLKDRVDEMAKDKNGDTALHIAAQMGFSFVAKILINDRTIDAQGANNLTPLHIASMNGDLELANLLEGANIASSDSKFGWTPLHFAADSGNDQLVKSLIGRGAQIDAQDHHVGWTPLHFAAINGHATVVDILLCQAANINVEDKYGWTPLQFAGANEHTEVVKLLKRSDAHVPAHSFEDLAFGDRLTLPHCMAVNNQRGLMERLLTSDSEVCFDSGAPCAPIQLAAVNGLETTIRKMIHNGTSSITALASEGDTPLHWASRHGYETLTRVLLKECTDADKEAKNHATRTPLHCATEEGQADIVRLLIEAGANKETRDCDGQTPLHCAIEQKNEDIVRLLLEAGADKEAKVYFRKTPLIIAAYGGCEAIVRLLLDAGADKDARDTDGGTPLHYAIEQRHEHIVCLLLEVGTDKEAKVTTGDTPLIKGASRGCEAIVRLLLDAGADKEARECHGETPLHCAVEQGHEAIVRLLLHVGADKEARTKIHDTPLHKAAYEGCEAIVRLLLDAGADKGAKDGIGGTPLHKAARSESQCEDSMRLLLDVGADKEARDEFGGTPLYHAVEKRHEAIVRLLLNVGANKEAKTDYFETPLIKAAYEGYEAIVRLLLDAGADKEARQCHGKTPLHCAVQQGHEAIVHLLLDARADKDARDNHGETPLYCAVKERHETIVRLLLDAGADKQASDNYGGTPLYHATAYAGCEAIARLLLDAGAKRKAGDRYAGDQSTLRPSLSRQYFTVWEQKPE